MRLLEYDIKLASDDSESGVVKIFDLSEEFCKKMTTERDAGDRFSMDSRFTYHTEYDSDKELQCGTARAAVIRAIMNKLKPKNIKQFVKITKA